MTVKKMIIGDCIIWGLIVILLGTIYPYIHYSKWLSNSDLHASMEFISALLAFIVSISILLNFYATRKRFFLLLSLAFLLQGSEDLIHAFHVFTRIWITEQTNLLNFVPGTYVTGRILLITGIIISLFLKQKDSTSKNPMLESIIYTIIGFVSATLLTTFIISLPLPKLVFIDNTIGRPIDFIVGIIYFFTVLFLIKIYYQENNHSHFAISIITSIILGFGSQMYIAGSHQLYDSNFDFAHLLKIFSYTLPILGVSFNIFMMYKKEDEIQLQLRETITKLEKAFQEIKILSGLVPICSYCKKIRDDKGYWNQLETYLNKNTEATFTHGICPNCLDQIYKDNNLTKQSSKEDPKVVSTS